MPWIDLYCTCGASWRGALPEKGLQRICDEWASVHTGEGHAPCDALTARRARAKAERQAEKEMADA